MNLQLFKLPFITLHANDNDALIPEHWAAESMAILEENMVVAHLCHRDFEDEIAEYGDVVHTRKPSEFTAKRKIDSESVTTQDAVSTDILVPLDQHLHTSFVIKDGEASKSFKYLTDFYLGPAILSIAQQIDRIISGQALRWWYDGAVGQIGQAPTSTTLMLDTRNALNKLKAPVANRNLILTPDNETDFLKIEAFTSAEKVGDSGTALREASLGRKLGFNCFMAQNQPIGVVPTGGSASSLDDLNGTVAKGSNTFVTTTDMSATWVAGTVLNVGGDIQVVTAVTTVTLTCWPGARWAHADAEVVEGHFHAKTTAAFAVGWHKDITYDTITGFSVGQPLLISAETAISTEAHVLASDIYTVIEAVDSGTFVLDRPLDVALVDNSQIMPLPVGNYNFAFTKNAMALVTRPLALPPTNERAAVVNYRGLSIRVVMTYDGAAQGTRVTVDLLCGVAQLDASLGQLMLG